jgi:hypothetical protein
MDTLSDFFGGEMIRQLQNAREACAEIGAHAAATVLQRHLDDLAKLTDELTATRIAAGIPTQLACAGDDLDELIARYAADCVREGFSPG